MSKTAFVIDDNRLIANQMVQMLGLLGYEAKAAYGSLPGLQALGQIKPDLIVLDLHMQGVNGIEICRYIRRDPRLADVPVLAISSDNQEIMIAAVREAGANAFLNKPITIEALESALKQTQPPPTQPFKKDPNALAQTRPHKG